MDNTIGKEQVLDIIGNRGYSLQKLFFIQKLNKGEEDEEVSDSAT